MITNANDPKKYGPVFLKFKVFGFLIFCKIEIILVLEFVFESLYRIRNDIFQWYAFTRFS